MQRSLRATAGRCARAVVAVGVGAMMALGGSGVALADPSAPVTGTVGGDIVATVIKNLDRVSEVLAHSWPARSVADVQSAAKLTQPNGLTAQQLEDAVYAGTQAAIWHVVDPEDFELMPFSEIPRDERGSVTYPVLEAVYKYLLGRWRSRH